MMRSSIQPPCGVGHMTASCFCTAGGVNEGTTPSQPRRLRYLTHRCDAEMPLLCRPWKCDMLFSLSMTGRRRLLDGCGTPISQPANAASKQADRKAVLLEDLVRHSVEVRHGRDLVLLLHWEFRFRADPAEAFMYCAQHST